MYKGEGMMSLARGFIYEGFPSIVMTLWQVADQSSSDLMTSFYKYLKKGKSK
jgi:CHAT domain-containing protein